MYIALSIFIATVGAILRYAVADQVKGVDLAEIGLILLVVGAIGFVIAVIAEALNRQRTSERVIDSPGEPPVRERSRTY